MLQCLGKLRRQVAQLEVETNSEVREKPPGAVCRDTWTQFAPYLLFTIRNWVIIYIRVVGIGKL